LLELQRRFFGEIFACSTGQQISLTWRATWCHSTSQEKNEEKGRQNSAHLDMAYLINALEDKGCRKALVNCGYALLTNCPACGMVGRFKY
jgi:hypothetical protein